MFQANITFGSVETKTIQSGPSAGQKYATSRAVLNKKDGTTREVTVMAFGAQRESVAKLLRKGKTVTLSAVWDKRIVKIIGPRRQPKAKAAAA